MPLDGGVTAVNGLQSLSYDIDSADLDFVGKDSQILIAEWHSGRADYSIDTHMESVGRQDAEAEDGVGRDLQGEASDSIISLTCRQFYYAVGTEPESVRLGAPGKLQLQLIDAITAEVIDKSISHKRVGPEQSFTPQEWQRVLTEESVSLLKEGRVNRQVEDINNRVTIQSACIGIRQSINIAVGLSQLLSPPREGVVAADGAVLYDGVGGLESDDGTINGVTAGSGVIMFVARAGFADSVTVKQYEVTGTYITICNELVCGVHCKVKLIDAVAAERRDDRVVIEPSFIELVSPPDERQLVFADDGTRSVKELTMNDKIEPVD